MEMNWSSLLALVLLAYFVVSMLFTGVFLLLAVRPLRYPPSSHTRGLFASDQIDVCILHASRQHITSLGRQAAESLPVFLTR